MTDNAEQAKALADALLPHLIESLKTDVLPSLIEDQIGGLKKNTTELLDQFKKSQADKDATDKHAKQMADVAALLGTKKTPPDDMSPVQISREDARNRSKYLEAQELARKRGVAFEIVDARRDRQAHALDGQTHLKTETTMFIHKDAIRDARTYARLKAQAQDDHLEIQPISDWNDLPEGAVPHD